MTGNAIDVQSDIPLAVKRKRKETFSKFNLFLAILILSIYLAPFYYLLVTIFKSSEEYLSSSVLSLPQSLSPFLDNVSEAWTRADIGQAAFNSLSYGILGSGLAVAMASAAAYGLTRLGMRNANNWFLLIFAGTLFPFQLYLVPLFFGYQRLGLLNSWLGMLLIYTALGIPFPLLVLRNAFGAISREIDEAARIEGASEWRIYVSMILPNSTGPLLALFLLQFSGIWNDLLLSAILANGPKTRSIMTALQALQGTYGDSEPNIVITAGLISSLPTILLFIFLRKYFMTGFLLTKK